MPTNTVTRPREDERWPGLQQLFACVPLETEAKDTLFGLMSAPDRIYHSVSHLTLLWERHERYAPRAGFDSARANKLVACSIAFHDCIYNAARRDSEIRSAETWMRLSSGSGLSEADREWVAGTIRATADHLSYEPEPTTDADQRQLDALRSWVLDLDLTPFGETPFDFDNNTVDLRAEHKHLSAQQWEANRLRLLRRLAAAPMIYRNAVLAEAFDTRARLNIGRQLVIARDRLPPV